MAWKKLFELFELFEYVAQYDSTVCNFNEETSLNARLQIQTRKLEMNAIMKISTNSAIFIQNYSEVLNFSMFEKSSTALHCWRWKIFRERISSFQPESVETAYVVRFLAFKLDGSDSELQKA